MVAPRVGAWIETGKRTNDRRTSTMSHPVWVRGLKRRSPNAIVPAGAVVAPRVGAWIETVLTLVLVIMLHRRTPCGRVD